MDGGPVALPGPHRARRPTIDAWVASAHDGGGAGGGVGLPDPECADRQRRPMPRRVEHFRERETFARQSRRTGRRIPARRSGWAPGKLRPPEALLAWESCRSRRRRPSCRRTTPGGASRALPVRGSAGPGHDVVLGRPAHGPHAGAARCRGHPPRIGQASRRRPPRRRCAPDGGPVLGARADLRRAQHEQEEPDHRSERAARPRPGAPRHRRPATS